MALDWNFRTQHVELNSKKPQGWASEDFQGIDFARGSSTVIAVGPRSVPDLSTVGAITTARTQIRILGLTQSVDANTQKQITEAFEQGSFRRFILPGVTFNRLQLARLLAANGVIKGTPTPQGLPAPGVNTGLYNTAQNLLAKLYSMQATTSDAGSPFAFDLSGISASIPVGVIVALYTPDGRGIGAVYGVDGYIETSAFRSQAQGDTVADMVSIRLDRYQTLNPIQMAMLLEKKANDATNDPATLITHLSQYTP